jgi:multiple sugar transport system permease protein
MYTQTSRGKPVYWISLFLRYLVLSVVLAWVLMPVVWIVLTAFKPKPEWVHTPPIWIPSRFIVDNFTQMWTSGGGKAFGNSLMIATSSTVSATFLGAMAAYSISRFQTGGSGVVNWILSVRFLPPIAFTIPLVILFKTAHLLDTHYALILTYVTFNLPFVVWTLKGTMDEIPIELDESAMMDGCSRYGALFRIILPLAGGGLVATGLITFVFTWTEYLFALMNYRAKVLTVPIRLSQYFTEAQGLDWGPQAALAVISIVPMLAIAFVGQRFLVRAITMGAVK